WMFQGYQLNMEKSHQWSYAPIRGYSHLVVVILVIFLRKLEHTLTNHHLSRYPYTISSSNNMSKTCRVNVQNLHDFLVDDLNGPTFHFPILSLLQLHTELGKVHLSAEQTEQIVLLILIFLLSQNYSTSYPIIDSHKHYVSLKTMLDSKCFFSHANYLHVLNLAFVLYEQLKLGLQRLYHLI